MGSAEQSPPQPLKENAPYPGGLGTCLRLELCGCGHGNEQLRLHSWNIVSSTIAEMICPIRIWHSWMREVSLEGAQIQ